MSASVSTSTTISSPTTLKILMLHGFTQSSSLFNAKTRALHKALTKAFPPTHYTLSLTYPCAPHKLPLADIPDFNLGGLDTPIPEVPDAYGWWTRKDHTDPRETVYEGLESGLDVVAACIRSEGPFDGVVGFSQGGVAAAMVAALLEGRGRREGFEKAEKEGGMPFLESFLAREGDKGAVDGFVQGPLKFTVCYSGLRAPGKRYQGFYEPKIWTPVLHVLGQVDVVVDEASSWQLVEACEGGEGRVVVHPGGHFVPSQKPWLDAVVGFVKECMEETGTKGKGNGEERVEDMDVPF